MKAYTDLEQSKKLEEILPLESADMYYDYDFQKHECCAMIMDEQFDDTCVRAWSLAALLEQLEGRNFVKLEIKYDDGQYYLFYVDDRGSIDMKTKHYNNLIDACYEMIIKLHEQNLL
jgi:hypothetical protein